MAGVAAATAAGAALFLYYSGRSTNRPPWPLKLLRGAPPNGPQTEEEESAHGRSPGGSFRAKPWRPPSAWAEAVATLGETLRFTYSETLGKWPLVDLAFGINWLTRTKGHTDVAAVYAGPGSVQLRGPDAIAHIQELLRLLNICILFKRPFPIFLESTGFKADQILLREGTAGLLKPAFVVIRDDANKTVLLIIRGTYSMKDTLTAVTGSSVPYHHIVTRVPPSGKGDVIVDRVVTGHAHCGMVASARWIGQRAAGVMEEVLKANPGYRLKIVGHSLGGGTASLLAYSLREKACFGGTEVVAFAPAACMTWDLSESGRPFVTSVINGFDLVPTFSCASVDDLRADVTASAWWPEFRSQMDQIRVLRLLMGGADLMGRGLSQLGHVPSLIGNSAGVVWRPVSSGARTAVSAVASVRPKLSWSGLACGGVRNRVNTPPPIPEEHPPEPGEGGFVMEMEREGGAEVRENLGGVIGSLSRSQSVGNLSEGGTSSGEGTPRHSRSRSVSRIDLTRQEEVTGLAAILNDVGRQTARDEGINDSDDEEEEAASIRSDASGLDRMQAELEALQAELDAKDEGERLSLGIETGPLETVDGLENESEEEPVKRAVGSEEWLQEKTRFFPPGKIMHIVRGPRGARDEPSKQGFQAEGSGDGNGTGTGTGNGTSLPEGKGAVPPKFSFAAELMRAWRPQAVPDAKPREGEPENSEEVPFFCRDVKLDVGDEIEVDAAVIEEGLPLSSGFGSPIEIEDRSRGESGIEGGNEGTTSSRNPLEGASAKHEPFVLRKRKESEQEAEQLGNGTSTSSTGEKGGTTAESSSASHNEREESFVYRLFSTDKKLYGKIWLSRSMVMDHYMPHYRRCLQEALVALEQDH